MSNSKQLVCEMKEYIQPFERILAIKELESLTWAQVDSASESDGSLTINTEFAAEDIAARLTYWERVWSKGNPLDCHYTRQVRNEATTCMFRNGVALGALGDALPFQGEVPLPSRRNLRYGPHGIHEYRGKFFPQLVRSLLNISGFGPESICLDPMCGSGTTGVETKLLGARAFAMDLNPLSAYVAHTKGEVLDLEPMVLSRNYEALTCEILQLTPPKNPQFEWLNSLPRRDREYVAQWFSEDVLAELDRIMVRIQQTREPKCRHFFVVVLSNILRRISWQKNDDLRVRKEIPDDFDVDVAAEFLSELNRSVRNVLALLYELKGQALGTSKVLLGDARRLEATLGGLVGKVDAVITSPPYATALPYLDTDRFSLVYLGLLSRPCHRRFDYEMIGNREVSASRRADYWRDFQSVKSSWPSDITRVIERVKDLNEDADVGFRRRNLPALLGRYFGDMEKVLSGFARVLRREAPAYVVVGNNHTVAGGERVEIKTDELLAQLGESVGLKFEEAIQMEMLVSRDIFRKNAGSAETILHFKVSS